MTHMQITPKTYPAGFVYGEATLRHWLTRISRIPRIRVSFYAVKIRDALKETPPQALTCGGGWGYASERSVNFDY